MTEPFAPSRRGVDQLGFVVADIEATMQYWAEVFGVGPFYYLKRSATKNLFYKGERAPVVSSTALAQAGDTQIELIQLRNDVPSAYRDERPHGLGSLHHVARFVEDYDGELQAHLAAGHQVVQEGDAGDNIHFCYLTDPARPGLLLELVEIGALRGFFQTIAEAAASWDGVDPIRPVTPSF